MGLLQERRRCLFLSSHISSSYRFFFGALHAGGKAIAAAVTFLVAVLGACLVNLRAKVIGVMPLDGFKKSHLIPVGVFVL